LSKWKRSCREKGGELVSQIAEEGKKGVIVEKGSHTERNFGTMVGLD